MRSFRAFLLARFSRQSSPAIRDYRAWLKLWGGRLLLWSGAIGVGLLSVLFAELSETLSSLFNDSAERHHWLPFLVTPLGGACCVWLTRRYFQGAEGSGIPQVLAEMRGADTHDKNQMARGPMPASPSAPEETAAATPAWWPLVSLRIATGKILLGAGALGCGFSLGREGPTVQIGASLMNALHRFLPASLGVQRKHLLVAGGAAGIAAAFNAPLAGIMFAIEEMTRSVEARMSGLVITAIVLAGVTAQGMKGDGGNYFGVIPIIAADGSQLAATLISALVCGVAGGLFARMMTIAASHWQGYLPRLRARHPIRFALLCGLFIACLGFATNGVIYGSGLPETQAMLEADGHLPWYFAPAKFVATLVAYFAGLPGGIFAPSLSIGAGLGHSLTPLFDQGATPGMLLALSMAGFLAAVTQAPMTSFLIVMEMIDGYSIVIGLMAVSFLSSTISKGFSPPLYVTLANQMLLASSAATVRKAG
jgi:H+/Cl- antiporter ClcA